LEVIIDFAPLDFATLILEDPFRSIKIITLEEAMFLTLTNFA
jgi:hypothetical protein